MGSLRRGCQVSKDFRADLNRRRTLLTLGGGLCAAAATRTVTAKANPAQASSSFPAIIETREFTVYFDNDDSSISQAGLGVIKEAIDFIQANANAANDPIDISRLVMVGHSDPSELATDVVALSEARAGRVADKFFELGVPADKIAVDWKGDTQPSDWLDGKTQAAANRRVTIDPIF